MWRPHSTPLLARLPLWVISGRQSGDQRCPLYLRKQNAHRTFERQFLSDKASRPHRLIGAKLKTATAEKVLGGQTTGANLTPVGVLPFGPFIPPTPTGLHRVEITAIAVDECGCTISKCWMGHQSSTSSQYSADTSANVDELTTSVMGHSPT